MKNKIKFITLLLTTMLSACLFTGCGTKEITAEESAQMFFNLAAHQDDTQMRELLGDNMSEFDIIVSDEVNNAKETAKSMLSSSDITLSDEELNKFVDALLYAMHQQECREVIVESEDKDFNTVDLTLKVSYVDLISLCEEVSITLQDELEDKVSGLSYLDIDFDALQNEFMKDYFAAVTEKLNNCEAGEDTLNIYTTFKKEKYKNGFMSNLEVWVPENSTKFGEEVGVTVLGQ